MIRIFLCGLAMGIADLIPGVSGGTVAFVLGIYEELLAAIRSIDCAAIRYFFTLRWSALQEHIPWRFLLSLGGGIALAILLFSHPIHWCLHHPLARRYLYALFLGLVVGSIRIVSSHIQKWSWGSVVALLVGAVIAAFIVTRPAGEEVELLQDPRSFSLYLIFCGMVASSAMLLPGVSGSYLLTIFGAYGAVIAALTAPLATPSLWILGSLGVGIFLGLALFSRVVSFLLQTFPSRTMAALTGFMVGALPALWPGFGWGPLFTALAGAVTVVAFDKIRDRSQQKA